jgi:hypothetical protein
MTGTEAANALTEVLKEAVGAACSCGARAWSMALERNLAGAVARIELRSR